MATGGGRRVAVDWAKVVAHCTPERRQKIIDVRRQHSELQRMLSETRAATPAIDWSFYRSALPHLKSTLDEMEAQVGAFKPAKTNLAAKLAEWQAERKTKIEESSGIMTELKTQITRAKGLLQRYTESKPLEQMEIDDVYKLRPEFREQFQKSIREDNWSTKYDSLDEGPETLKPGKYGEKFHVGESLTSGGPSAVAANPDGGAKTPAAPPAHGH